MPGRLVNLADQLICRGSSCLSLSRSSLVRWKDADETPVLALVLEKHHAVNQGEQGVVFPASDVQAGLVTRTALANQDRSGVDQLATKSLYTKPLPRRVAAVY